MATYQWTNEDWKQFEARIKAALDEKHAQGIAMLTMGQIEHPEWYESPCECDLCRIWELKH